jgi:hypothetical protein
MTEAIEFLGAHAAGLIITVLFAIIFVAINELWNRIRKL